MKKKESHTHENQSKIKISDISLNIDNSESVIENRLKNVLVFKTNVSSEVEAIMIVHKMLSQFPSHKINFDLDDCDKILRIEGAKVNPKEVINIVKDNSFQCCLL